MTDDSVPPPSRDINDAEPVDQETLDRVRQVFTAAPFIQHLGIELIELARGRCQAALTVDDRHRQHLGVVHGGVLTALAGHSALAAAMSVSGAVQALVAPDLNLSVMRSIREGRVIAVADVLKGGRTNVFVQVDVFSGALTPAQRVATGRFTLQRSASKNVVG